MASPPEHVQSATEEAQRLRGWIANGYAQVEYLLGDIVMKSLGMPEYGEINGMLPHRPQKRIERVRKILKVNGYFSKFSEEIEWIIAGFEMHHETRNLLAHGFCTIYHTPNEDVGFEFRKWHRDESNEDTEIRNLFRIVNLEYHKAQLAHISERALALSRTIHEELGLVG